MIALDILQVVEGSCFLEASCGSVACKAVCYVLLLLSCLIAQEDCWDLDIPIAGDDVESGPEDGSELDNDGAEDVCEELE